MTQDFDAEDSIDGLVNNIGKIRICNPAFSTNGNLENEGKPHLPSNFKYVKVTKKVKHEDRLKKNILAPCNTERLFVHTIKTNIPRVGTDCKKEKYCNNLISLDDLIQKSESKKNVLANNSLQDKITKTSNINAITKDKSDDGKHKINNTRNESLGKVAEVTPANRVLKCSKIKDKIAIIKDETLNVKEKNVTNEDEASSANKFSDRRTTIKDKTNAITNKTTDTEKKSTHAKEKLVVGKSTKDDNASYELIARGGIKVRDERRNEHVTPYTRHNSIGHQVNRQSFCGGGIIKENVSLSPEVQIKPPLIPETVNLDIFLHSATLYDIKHQNNVRPSVEFTSQFGPINTTEEISGANLITDADAIIDEYVRKLKVQDSSTGKDHYSNSYFTFNSDSDIIERTLNYLPDSLPPVSDAASQVPDSNPNDSSFYPDNLSPEPESISINSTYNNINIDSGYIDPIDSYALPNLCVQSPAQTWSEGPVTPDSSALSPNSSVNYSPYNGEYHNSDNYWISNFNETSNFPRIAEFDMNKYSPVSSTSPLSSTSSNDFNSSTMQSTSSQSESVNTAHKNVSSQSPIRKWITKNFIGKMINGTSPTDASELLCCKNSSVSGRSIMYRHFSLLEENIKEKLCLDVHKLPETAMVRLISFALKNLRPSGNQSRTKVDIAIIYIVCERLLMSNKFIESGQQLLQFAALNYHHIPYLAQYFGECIIDSVVRSNATGQDISFEQFNFDKFENNERDTLIHYLARAGDSASAVMAGLLTLKWPDGTKVYNANQLNRDGYTPLHLVCQKNHVRVDVNAALTNIPKVSYQQTIHILIQHGLADISIKDGKSGNTVLHTAVESKFCETSTIKSIIENLHDDTLKNVSKMTNYSGRTALELAKEMYRSIKTPLAKCIVDMLKKLK